MRIDKLTILLVCLLMVAVFDLKPRNLEYEDANNIQSFMIKKKQLAKEKIFFKNSQSIKNQTDELLEEIKNNEKAIFPDSMEITPIQTLIQKKITVSFRSINLVIDNFRWLDPVYKKEGYVNIPVSFSVAGSPAQLMEGLKILLRGETILSIPMYTLRGYPRDKNLLELNATIVGFKKNET